MKEKDNILKIGNYKFSIIEATFGFVIDDGFGNSGWNFRVETEPDVSISKDDLLYKKKISFRAEADKIPIPHNQDLLGVEIFLELPYDEETGDVYFTLYVFEHGDLTKLSLKFVDKKEEFYRMLVKAKVPKGTVTSQEEDLIIDTWIKQLPDKNTEQ